MKELTLLKLVFKYACFVRKRKQELHADAACHVVQANSVTPIMAVHLDFRTSVSLTSKTST